MTPFVAEAHKIFKALESLESKLVTRQQANANKDASNFDAELAKRLSSAIIALLEAQEKVVEVQEKMVNI
jgi:hypothetical protein